MLIDIIGNIYFAVCSLNKSLLRLWCTEKKLIGLNQKAYWPQQKVTWFDNCTNWKDPRCYNKSVTNILIWGCSVTRKFAFQPPKSKLGRQIGHTFWYLQTCQGMLKVWEVSKCMTSTPTSLYLTSDLWRYTSTPGDPYPQANPRILGCQRVPVAKKYH
jgi:hypothetical protein